MLNTLLRAVVAGIVAWLAVLLLFGIGDEGASPGVVGGVVGAVVGSTVTMSRRKKGASEGSGPAS